MKKTDHSAAGKPPLSDLERRIAHTFGKREYLEIAVTHSSYTNEGRKHLQNNERQEFLGDAVLSIVVSDYLFHRFHMAEGDLTKLRANLVCEKSLCGFARQIGLGSYLLMGKGEDNSKGYERPSILADAFEALIAAIYLDSGIESARAFIIPFVEEALRDGEAADNQDYKTLLQEIVQQNPGETLAYALTAEDGPDHDKHFRVEVRLNSNVLGAGEGRTKKLAEQMAAREALKLMGQIED